jgi:hypothetical protein
VNNLIVHDVADADAASVCNPFQTCCDVHPITKNVTAIDDDVTDIDANAELDPLLLWHLGVALDHSSLDIYSAAHCIHDAGEFYQHALAGGLDDPPAVFVNLGIDQGAPVCL